MGTVAEPTVEHAFRSRVPRNLAAVLEQTAARYPRCQCDLHAGLTRDELVALGGGCTDSRGFVCDRLAAVRRRCGL